MSHDTLERIIQLPQASSDITLADLLARGRTDLGADEVVVQFSRDVIHKLVCPRCNEEEDIFAPVGAIDRTRGQCLACSAATGEPQMRIVRTLTGFHGEPELASRTLDTLGLPLFDIFTVRSADLEVSYCIAGDAPKVLAPLAPRSEVTA